MNINFGELISRSFHIAWRYKTLWVFGLFTGAGSGGFNIDLPEGLFKDQEWFGRSADLERWFSNFDIPSTMEAPLIGALILWGLALAILFTICYLIAQPAIIDGVNKITRGGHYTFGGSFSRGLDFFWRFFGMLVIAIISIVVLVMVVVVAVLALKPIATAAAILGGVLAFFVALIAAFFIWHTVALGEVAIVARDCSIGDGLAEGWELVTHNKLSCFLISVISAAFGIAFAIAITIVTLVAFVPVGVLVGILTGNLIATIVLGLIFALPISILLGGFSGTFFNALYVQFYFSLYEPLSAEAPAAPAGPVL